MADENYRDAKLARILRTGYDPSIEQSLQVESDDKPLPEAQLKKCEKAILQGDLASEIQETDPDQTLRDLGFPDSTESRSCIRKKSR